MKFFPSGPKPTVEDAIAQLQLLHPDLMREATMPLVDKRIAQYITIDDPCKQLLRNAKLVAFRSEPVLIQGESGTGKELLAKILLGNKPDDQFNAINCAGIVDTLFESLIFGHTRGAFTGALSDKSGILVTAGTGVAFFDEVGELPLTQQAKLLRALQERKVMPVGAAYEIPIRCRFVFATNRDLEQMVKTGTFREDLYFRISPLTLHTIPLRERPHDAGPIAEDYCKRNDFTMPEQAIPDKIIQSPGNIRALQNWLLQQEVWGPQ